MDLSFYQLKAIQTAIYPDSERISYPAMGLAGEVGEVMNKIKKVYRDKGGKFDTETKKAIASELGDVLWYLAVLSQDLGQGLEDIAASNLKKLQSRQERGTLSGSGDTR
ncbi:nucleotide pyrophosphohydrolase [Roseobacter phage CRP-403]|uniref:Nucleotide pyrophosphohydrolase n=1 Tax=Roseobacter phage CRP-403 TaxID=3072849 RepID=A0AAX3ZXB3_9CAUD|nr:nucleotide pyrophosphohydrolase [Roseobacter phage CRP-403]